jgi:hypothetical protein
MMTLRAEDDDVAAREPAGLQLAGELRDHAPPRGCRRLRECACKRNLHRISGARGFRFRGLRFVTSRRGRLRGFELIDAISRRFMTKVIRLQFPAPPQ